MKLLVYCNKENPYLYQGVARPMHTTDITNPFNYKWKLMNYKTQNALNGKIPCECDFEIEKIDFKHIHERDDLGRLHNEWWWEYRGMNIGNEDCELVKYSCMNVDDIMDYLNKDGYAIHIKNLHIFDSPKELNELYSIHDIGDMLLTDKLKKAPSNMQYISLKEWEYGTFNPNDVAILTSISSECLCKILNGEKTIIIKKKVLKEML